MEKYVFDLMLYLILYVFVILIHELGHIILYALIKGKLPKIKFKWWGIEILEEADKFSLTPLEYISISYAGIFFGIIFLSIIDLYAFRVEIWFLLLYLIMCSIDMFIISQLIDFIKYKGSVGKIEIEEWRKRIYHYDRTRRFGKIIRDLPKSS